MSPSERPLGRHLPASLDDARLARQLGAVAARLERRPFARRRLVVLTTASLAVAGLVALRVGTSSRSPGERATARDGTSIEALAEAETITLADGSRAVLDPQSKLTLLTTRAELVRVALERGGVDLDVVHAEGKRFVVLARGYEIRVLGTRFTVRLGEDAGAPAVAVSVARGRVRVTRVDDDAHDDTDERVLDAGETWSAAPRTPAITSPSVTPAGEGDGAPAARSRVAAGGESARQLLARAEAYRTADEPRAAARTLDALRTRHRGDARAGLAAFELGRLRLERLGDPRGAAEAFDDALTLAPAAPFREDAQARLVEAYAAAGQRARCLDAQAAYLARYPRGLHRQKVAARCPE